jgi:hypothetical protein
MRNQLKDGAIKDRPDPVLGAVILTLIAARQAGDDAAEAVCLRRLDSEYGVKLASPGHCLATEAMAV